MWIKHEDGLLMETAEMIMIKQLEGVGIIEVVFSTGDKWRGRDRFYTKKTTEPIQLNEIVFPVEVKK